MILTKAGEAAARTEAMKAAAVGDMVPTTVTRAGAAGSLRRMRRVVEGVMETVRRMVCAAQGVTGAAWGMA